jgi:hypothetical protein
MAVATTTALLIAAGASAAAAGVSAVGAIQSGQAAKNQANFQSAIAQQQADRERLAAAQGEEDFRRQQSRAMATRRAQMGGSGIDTSTGSPLLVSEDFAGESELQALRIRNGGEVSATRLEQSAALQRSAGANAVTDSYFRAGSSLLTGAGQAFGAYAYRDVGSAAKTR